MTLPEINAEIIQKLGRVHELDRLIRPAMEEQKILREEIHNLFQIAETMIVKPPSGELKL